MSDFSYTEPVRLNDMVQRLTCNNPGVMTGPGTNSYILGRECLAIVDPGPANPEHIENLLRIVGDRLHWILATHTHSDHSPAAAALAAATGAEVWGNRLDPDDGFQDRSFAPTSEFVDGQRLITDEFTIRAVATPGHVNNHFCFFLEEEGMLFTGDHIMQGSTVVIIPPHGNMGAYIRSLEKLEELPLQALAPAHGGIIRDPKGEIRRLVAHRLKRESKVVTVLERMTQGTLEELTPAVYDDVDPSLHPVAKYSLWAHLIKLSEEQRVDVDGDIYRYT